MMNEGGIRIVIKEENRRNVQNIYFEWRKSLGDSIVFEPPQSAGILQGNIVDGITLNNVPRDFLPILKEKGISYSILQSK